MKCTACRKSAFTLLEVILATSIALVLLAALYTSLKLHLSTAQWGPQAAQQTQLSRAMTERIRRDVTSLVLPQDRGVVRGTLTDVRGRLQMATRYTGFRGGQQWLEFYSAQRNIDMDRAVPTPTGISRIRYELIPGRTDSAGNRAVDSWTLTRTQVPAEFSAALDAGRQSAARWARADVVADNIFRMEFQYWDRNTRRWTGSWSPHKATRPPTAMKVVFRLVSAGEPMRADSAWQGSYGYVIPIRR